MTVEDLAGAERRPEPTGQSENTCGAARLVPDGIGTPRHACLDRASWSFNILDSVQIRLAAGESKDQHARYFSGRVPIEPEYYRYADATATGAGNIR